jgi:hypothetical protein
LAKKHKIVEVAVQYNGSRTAIGLMNIEQALALPKVLEFEISQPVDEASTTNRFITRQDLLRPDALANS